MHTIIVELPAWLYYLMAANLCLTGATFFMKLLDRIDKR